MVFRQFRISRLFRQAQPRAWLHSYHIWPTYSSTKLSIRTIHTPNLCRNNNNRSNPHLERTCLQTRPSPAQYYMTRLVKQHYRSPRPTLAERACTRQGGHGRRRKKKPSWLASIWSRALTGVKSSRCLGKMAPFQIFSRIARRCN